MPCCIEPLSIVPELRGELERALANPRPFTKPKLEAPYGESAVAPLIFVDGVLTPYRLEILREYLMPFTKDDGERRPLVLRVDSPGGMVSGVPETTEILRRVAKVRPVIVVAENYLASAAYWLTSPATTIVATPTCKVGSCGVLSTIVDDMEAWSKQGIRFVVVATSPAKLFGQIGVPVDEEMKEAARRSNAQILYLFARDLIRSPRLNEQQMEKAFKAEIHLADAALGYGMIDQVALVEDVIESINAQVTDRFSHLRGAAAERKLDRLIADAAGVTSAWAAPVAVRNRIRAEYQQLAAAADAHQPWRR